MNLPAEIFMKFKKNLRPHLFLTYYQSKSLSKNAYSNTINIPNSSFPYYLTNNLKSINDEYIYNIFNFENLYSEQLLCKSLKTFTIHDGPPYANGPPHLGHAINKILKDIYLRQYLLKGYVINYTMGWDCHGLPIELKAISQKDSKEVVTIRKTCLEYANLAILKQKKAFMQWGLLANWNDCYFTYNKNYQINQFIQFYELYKKGIIYRDFLPIYWSPSSKSTLAESELIYNETHQSLGMHVAIKLNNHSICEMGLSQIDESKAVYAIVWTTCPWTLPFNQALCFNKNLTYQYVSTGKLDIIFLAEEIGMEKLMKKLGHDTYTILATIKGDKLEGTTYYYPFEESRIEGDRILLKAYHGDFVKAGKGTGLVHIAPPHGQDDFKIAQAHGLSKECYVDEDGSYVTISNPTPNSGSVYQSSSIARELQGLNVFSGTATDVIKRNLLIQPPQHKSSQNCRGLFLLQEDHIHSYPYDWRTNQPVLVKTSSQWFLDTSKVLQACLNVLPSTPSKENDESSVQFGMLASSKRMRETLASRAYWCISRQRSWGIPIPVFHLKSGGKKLERILLEDDTVQYLAELVRIHGPDIWWQWDVKELLPPTTLSNLKASLGGELEDLGYTIEKGTDIFDIWFDSGLSWYNVLGPEGQADACLEGIDQHTGWFQASLLTSMALRGKAPYKRLLAHGFVVDEKGNKMSKSLGNVISPSLITHGVVNSDQTPSYNKSDKKPRTVYGVDTLRWFVAWHSNLTTIPCSTQALDACHRRVNKLRNVLKFLLGASAQAYTHCSNHDSSSPVILTLVDTYFLTLAGDFEKRLAAIDYYAVNERVREIYRFTQETISALVITCLKDRLYCGHHENDKNDLVALSAPYVAAVYLECLCRALAPIVPHLAEEISLHHPLNFEREKSVMPKYTVFRKPTWIDYASNRCEQSLGNNYGAKKLNNLLGSELIEPRVRYAFDLAVRGIKPQFHKLDVSKDSKAMDLTILAEPKLYHILKLIQTDKISTFSSLVEIFGTASVTLSKCDFNDTQPSFEISASEIESKAQDNQIEVNLKYNLKIVASPRSQCLRCWKWICEEHQELCSRCESSLATGNYRVKNTIS